MTIQYKTTISIIVDGQEYIARRVFRRDPSQVTPVDKLVKEKLVERIDSLQDKLDELKETLAQLNQVD